jgi:serine/threonine-protein kinase
VVSKVGQARVARWPLMGSGKLSKRAIPTMKIEPLMNTRAGIPVELNDIVMKCLAKNKEARYQTAGSLYNDIDKLKKKMKITFDTSDLASFMKEHFANNGQAK